MNHNPYFIRLRNTRYYGLLLFIWVAVLLGPRAGFGAEQSGNDAGQFIAQRVPAGVLQELVAGRFQDLIVEFEHQDIRGEAADRRQARHLRFNDTQITAAGLTLFGTSQAAPHVSGAIAILRSAFPADSLDDTLSKLQSTGVSVTDHRNLITKPRLSFQSTCSLSDQEKDCVPDSSDNCPSDANPNQEDADEDGLGDICDACPNDSQNDLDGDAICGDIDTDDDGDRYARCMGRKLCWA